MTMISPPFKNKKITKINNSIYINKQKYDIDTTKKVRCGDIDNLISYKHCKRDKYLIIKCGEHALEDIHVINHLQKHNYKYNQHIVPHVISTHNDEPCIIMEKYEGSLYDLVSGYFGDHITCVAQITNDSKTILLQLIGALQYLISINLYYTDIKCENILYKINNNNDIIVVLGDLGSASDLLSNHVSTYPPFERNVSGGVFNDPNESDIVWGIGILLLQLHCISVYKFDYVNIKTMSKTWLKIYINNFIKKNKTLQQYEQILHCIFTNNSNDRSTLQEIKEMIENIPN